MTERSLDEFECVRCSETVVLLSRVIEMKQIYIVLCLSLLSGVAHADKWLCGTSSWWPAGPGWICGTDLAENPERRYSQYFFVLDETRKDEDGLSRVMFREVGGKVAFNGDICSDSTETELSCDVNGHHLSFDRTNYSFDYWHDFDYWLRKEAKRAENQSKSNVVVVDVSKSGSFGRGDKRYLEVSGVCTPFVNHETNSNLDFNYDPETIIQMLSASK